MCPRDTMWSWLQCTVVEVWRKYWVPNDTKELSKADIYTRISITECLVGKWRLIPNILLNLMVWQQRGGGWITCQGVLSGLSHLQHHLCQSDRELLSWEWKPRSDESGLVMVHPNMVKVLGFSFAGGSWIGGSQDAGGYPTHPSQICPLCGWHKSIKRCHQYTGHWLETVAPVVVWAH